MRHAVAMISRWQLLVVAALTGATGLSSGGPADASFGGRNGEIVFDLSRETQDGSQETCRTPSCGYTRIFAISPLTRSVRRVRTCRAGCVAEDYRPAAARGGQRIVFERTLYSSPGSFEQPLFGLITSDRAGGSSRMIVEEGRNATWAPSGVRVAYEYRAGSGGRAEIYIYREREGTSRKLTSGGGAEPDWSSRGRIAFTRAILRDGRRTGRYGLYSVWPNGRGLRLITQVGAPAQPNWSPDGRFLVYTDLPRAEIYRIRADGTGRRRISVPGAVWPVWSPDGKRIAFNRGYRSIMVMNRDGSGLRRLFSPKRTGLTSPLGRISWSSERHR